MKNIDRRNWLKTVGLSGSFALLSGLDGFAADIAPRVRTNDDLAKLNANENPYGPSEKVRKHLASSFDLACRYPFRTLSGFVKLIAEKEGVSKDHIVITGGSTEGLKACGLVYGGKDSEIIAADPTFQALLRYAENFGAHIHRVPLNQALEHDLEAMSKKISSKTSLIFICNPNNPSGTLLAAAQLKDFCLAHDQETMIFSDEAYYDFITEPDYPSMVELVKKDRNIIVSRTFSKVYGLAGMRIGYLIARPDIANKLKKAVMANTNILALEAAKVALSDDEFYKFSILKNHQAKEHVYGTLDELGLPYVKSHTNFVFFRSGQPIGKLIPAMREKGVIIGRPFPPYNDWARISTGTMADMDLFGKALKEVLS
ncbi:MAG: pyridoxal phosphate-dependent aminotransferase [Flavobacteriaceae bacterium]